MKQATLIPPPNPPIIGLAMNDGDNHHPSKIKLIQQIRSTGLGLREVVRELERRKDETATNL